MVEKCLILKMVSFSMFHWYLDYLLGFWKVQAIQNLDLYVSISYGIWNRNICSDSVGQIMWPFKISPGFRRFQILSIRIQMITIFPKDFAWKVLNWVDPAISRSVITDEEADGSKTEKEMFLEVKFILFILISTKLSFSKLNKTS